MGIPEILRIFLTLKHPEIRKNSAFESFMSSGSVFHSAFKRVHTQPSFPRGRYVRSQHLCFIDIYERPLSLELINLKLTRNSASSPLEIHITVLTTAIQVDRVG